jgi:hypothetical protein
LQGDMKIRQAARQRHLRLDLSLIGALRGTPNTDVRRQVAALGRRITLFLSSARRILAEISAPPLSVPKKAPFPPAGP